MMSPRLGEHAVESQAHLDLEEGSMSDSSNRSNMSSSINSTHFESDAKAGGETGVFEADGDFALERVSAEARYSWMSLVLENWSICGCIASVLLGVTVGNRMTLQSALLSCAIGETILGAITTAVGCVGCREGMTSSLLCRWTGFGSSGSAVLSVVIAISLTGWFGIQSAIAGDGMVSLLGGPPSWVWTLVAGAVVTVVGVMGFRWMVNIAWITAPAFFAALVWGVCKSLTKFSFSELMIMQPKGEPLTSFDGTGLIVGGWIVGAVVSADTFRWSHSCRDVVVAVWLGRVPALLIYNMAGVLIATAYGSSDFIALMRSSVGWGAVVIVIAGELAVNSLNLYITGLATVNFFDTVLGWKIHRRVVTLVCSIIGSALGAAGLLSHFVEFLTVLSVVFPPIAGIILCEYCCVKRFRANLDASRQSGALPQEAPRWMPATLIVWLSASLLGWYIEAGIPCLYSFFGAAVLYAFAARCEALYSGVKTELEVNGVS
eukprot:TRINITY_DN94559_c0_g1_i1.p1 TRINITY_DN94559_c0_g1~~TRINITY_DN94559_c0_g1_i1.p1  ORF type:complete len:490 (+),score=52.37 TRINITY_DN94559_c0_g1_i1:42-1511(+)